MEVVVSILAGDVAGLAAAARSQAPQADVIELRLDACAGIGRSRLAELFAGVGRPVLAAVNGPEAFGTFAGDDAARIRALHDAADAGAAWIDVPWTLARQLGPVRAPARRCVSRHVLDGTPRDLAALVAETESVLLPGDRLKIVTHAACAEDGVRVLLAVAERARAGAPIVGFASGAAGAFTRVLAPVFGSLATYAAPARGTGAPTAPGQVPVDELRASWPARGPDSATRVFAVLGRPVGHSLSPRVHGAGLRVLGLDAVYVAMEPASIAGVLELCADPRFCGFSVTMPFKSEAARLSIDADEGVRACGAANTLLRTPFGWRALNTDATAVRECVAAALQQAGRGIDDARAVVVGTGGAARAALHGLAGARCFVAGRDAAKREELARAFGATACALGDVGRIEYDVLVHTTPLGSRAHADMLPVAAGALRRGAVVLDAVYLPRETPLLRAARAAGARTVGGADWFLRQACGQFRAFTGHAAPVAVMEAELERALDVGR